MFSQYTPQDRMALWKAVTGHVLALILTFGFFGIVFLALTGKVTLSDPTTATFVGTVTGYAIGQLARPLAYYFAIAREIVPEKKNGEIISSPPLPSPPLKESAHSPIQPAQM